MGKDDLGAFSIAMARTFAQYVEDSDDATNPSFIQWRSRVKKKERDKRYRDKKRSQRD